MKSRTPAPRAAAAGDRPATDSCAGRGFIGERLQLDGAALAQTLQVPAPDARREIQSLLCRALDVELAALIAHPEASLEGVAAERYSKMLARRQAQVPLAYIIGEREFYGLGFEVTPDVLIPRPETELLVELAMECIPKAAPWKILDLGTGSGCIAVTLAKLLPYVRIVAIDLSGQALAVAARNAQRHHVINLELRGGSWFEPVAGERFDAIVSNPPYVTDGNPHLKRGDLRFEPSLALVGGADGLEALRAIVMQAPRYLVAGGWLLVEHGYDQSTEVIALMRAAGFGDVCSRNDLAGIPRIAAGRRP